MREMRLKRLFKVIYANVKAKQMKHQKGHGQY